MVKDDKKKTVMMECIVHSDSPPKVKVMKGTETIVEDKNHFAKVEQVKEVREFILRIMTWKTMTEFALSFEGRIFRQI